MKPRSKQFYDDLANRIYNLIKNRYSNVTRWKKVGSRQNETFQRTSDLDIRFSVSGNPPRSTVYPQLKEYLETKLSDVNGEKLRYKIGEERHVLQIYPEKGGKIDLVLLSETEYDRQTR